MLKGVTQIENSRKLFNFVFFMVFQLRVEKEEKEQLQKQSEDKSQRIQELLDTLNASRESEVKLEETFRQELVAQKKLADIYQGMVYD